MSVAAYDSVIPSGLRSICCAFATILSIAVLLAASWAFSFPRLAFAANLTERSLYINDPDPAINTRHEFTFSYGTGATPVGSVVFEYCTSPLPDLPCDTPAGSDASGAVLADQSGTIGYALLLADTGRIIISHGTPAPPLAGSSRYVFENVVNPAGASDTFYVRIMTYASSDGTGLPIDFGAVVNSTAQGVALSTEVPPLLNFCVGVSIPGDCSTAEGHLIDLGDLTPKLTASGTSQMMVGTNADFGVSIAAYGTTMTSGNSIIPALVTPTVSAPGNGQFGLNLRANSSPAVGQEPSGIGIVNPTSRYGSANQFAFVSGDTVASSPDVTDIRKLTVSYIVNVPPSQTPGVYTATLTYICTASF